MVEESKAESKTKYFYRLICVTAYLLGGPNHYHEELDLPKFIFSIHDAASKVVNVIISILVVFEWGALYTQHNLTDKQKGDLILFCLGHPLLFAFGPVVAHYTELIKDVSYTLAIKLKENYNDLAVEVRMIKMSKIYLSVLMFFLFSTIIFNGMDAVIQGVTADKSFVTTITAWPDVDDKSRVAGFARVIAYLCWWLFLLPTTSGYVVLIPLTICLSHQYRNLHSYFCSLNDIFEDTIDLEEMERKYEDAVKLGIRHHSETLRCTRLLQKVCNFLYSGQIFVNVVVMILLLSQMQDPARTPSKTLAIFMMATCMLTTTGCLMWSAGDITVEATRLPSGMFNSGWQHCTGATARRVRSLLVIAMGQSQRPVELQCLGVVTLSYDCFLSIVRASYSVFSVLY